MNTVVRHTNSHHQRKNNKPKGTTMIGEREHKNTNNTNYGTLVAHTFDIAGNNIIAFYDDDDNLIFVLDNTINEKKPNVLLVINPDGDKKWDEILSSDYDVDLENIRPKADNKYQKLDIEYSGLAVYENLINAHNAGDDISEQLNQLNILRDSATRHSAMVRLNVANETIAKTNATIVKTRETIVRLQTRIKTLRSKLTATKKEIGRVATKQSASKILKLESQIDATNEKLKRAKKRLESAQRRLETATVDAELASDLLNQPSSEIKQTPKKNKSMVVARDYPIQTTTADDDDDTDDMDDEEFDEDYDEEIEIPETTGDVKPLFEKDPQILNEDIAFKPISFDAPVFNEIKDEPSVPVSQPEPAVPAIEPRPVLESMTPISEPENSFMPEPEPNEEFSVPEIPVPEFIPEPVAQDQVITESFAPVADVPEFTPEPITDEKTEIETTIPEPIEPTPVVEPIAAPAPVSEPTQPAAPVINNFQTPSEIKSGHSRPGILYYLLLLVLIGLSVFTLWLYQKNISTDTKTPALVATAPETRLTKSERATPTPKPNEEAESESVFLDDGAPEQPTPIAEPIQEQPEPEIIEDEENDEEYVEPSDVAPVVMDAVPGRLNTSGTVSDTDIQPTMTDEEIMASKPIYEPGAKYDEMFVDETVYAPAQTDPEIGNYEYGYEYTEDDPYFDAEEAAYQAEINNQ